MKTILIVEDSSIARMRVIRAVKPLGLKPIEVADGEAGLEACRNEIPDCVLVDTDMPKMNGYEFVTQLRQLPDGDKPKVIFCVGDDGQIETAKSIGADECLCKPFNAVVLTKALERLRLL